MTQKRTEIAGAAVLAGVAAAGVGSKVAWDKHAAARREEQAFHLHDGESVPEGVRRIARGQLDEAHAKLDGTPKRKLGDGVHDARKSLKRLRATVRLSRDALGETVYDSENTAFRDTGRLLSGARDAEVLLETLDGIVERAGAELPAGTTAALRARLENDHAHAVAKLRDDAGTVAVVVAELEAARMRAATWTFRADGIDALTPGLKRIYRRGRKALRHAERDPSSEHLHEWRKRVKDLWHAEQILRPAAPKKMKKLAKRTHALADLLGDDHDLAELQRYVQTHADCLQDGSTQAALLAVVDRRRADLQREALALGADLYSARPKRFARKIERRFLKRAPA